MGKGGQQTSTTRTEIDPQLREVALQNMRLADEIGSIGTPINRGAQVAGFTPQQMAAFQGTDQAASAFGMPSAVNWQQGANGQMQAPRGMDQAALMQALTGMTAPTADAGNGMRGYSFAPGFDAARAQMPAAQLAAIEGFSRNPHTGAGPTNAAMPQPQTRYDSQGRVVQNAGAQRARTGNRLDNMISRYKQNRSWSGDR